MRNSRQQAGFSNQSPERIAIIKPSALGDVVQSLPLARTLKLLYPLADITWVINRELQGLLVDHPYLADTICFERRGGFLKYLRLLAELRRRRFDLVIDLQGLLRTGVMTWATRAPTRLGMQTAREGSQFACTALIPNTERAVPAHLRYRNVAEYFTKSSETLDWRISADIALSATDRSWVDDQLRDLPRPLIAVHPGAGWITKRWPVESFATALSANTGSVVVVGSAGERSLADDLSARLVQKGPPIKNLSGQTSLKQLAALLQSVDLVLSNDSGPMHLAAAMGTRVLGLFMCTSSQISGPAGISHELVSTAATCGASYQKKCPYHGPAYHACFSQLAVEEVRSALKRMLGQ